MPTAFVRLDDTSGLRATVTARQHAVIVDEPVDMGGTDTGMTPTELMLGALGACAAITMQLYAQRKGWSLASVEIDLSGERHKAADYPKYEGSGDFVHEFVQRIHITGDLDDAQKQRLLEIAGKCPVHRALAEPKVMIEEIVEAALREENQ